MSDEHGLSGSDAEVSAGKVATFLARCRHWHLLFSVILGVYVTIPVRLIKAPPPDPAAQSIQDLKTSLQQRSIT